jgi:hypothetical protein
MSKIRYLIIFLLSSLLLFFYIDRLGEIIGLSGFHTHSAAFLPALVLIIFIFATPVLQRLSILMVLIIWFIIFLFSKQISGDQLLAGGISTLTSLAEFVFLSIVICSAHNIATQLNQNKEVLNRIFLADASDRVNEMDKANEIINRELLRSRRYGHPFSIISLRLMHKPAPLEKLNKITNLENDIFGPYTFAQFLHLLDINVRRLDIVFYQRYQEHVIILLPETDNIGGKALVRNLHSLAERAGFEFNSGVASFPADALTLDDLIKVADTTIKVPTRDVNSHPADISLTFQQRR